MEEVTHRRVPNSQAPFASATDRLRCQSTCDVLSLDDCTAQGGLFVGFGVTCLEAATALDSPRIAPATVYDSLSGR